MLNKSCRLLFSLICAVMWGLYVDYSSSAVEHIQCGMHICLGAYANDVNYMYTRVPVHIVDCPGFMGGIYIGLEVSYMDMNYLASVAYMWHFRDILVLSCT